MYFPYDHKLLINSFLDCLSHIINHLICHSWIYTYPECISHNSVCVVKSSYYSVAFSCCLISSKQGCFIRLPAKRFLVWTPWLSIYSTIAFLSRPSLTVIRKPNQLGLELSQGTGRITLSSISASAALNLSKLCLLLSTNEGTTQAVHSLLLSAYLLP